MPNLSYYNIDGKIFLESENNISVNNRSFRYGDGFFETIKLANGKIQLKELHFERILYSLKILGFIASKHFSFEGLEKQIIELATKNNHQYLGRIRITFFREDAGLFEVIDFHPHILIQSFELNESVNELNQNQLAALRLHTIGFVLQRFNPIATTNALNNVMTHLQLKKLPRAQAIPKALGPPELTVMPHHKRKLLQKKFC